MIRIAVDTGTTNTRIIIAKDSEIINIEKCNVGIRDVALNGNIKILEDTILELILEGLNKVNKTLKDVSYIVGSGMITSNLGLLEIPHVEAPVSYKELSKNVQAVNFDWLDNIPFYFIPGVKNRCEKSLELLSEIDVMRGEEVETIGILDMYGIDSKCLIILPGSHTKFAFVDHEGKIQKCATTMLGEMFNALVEKTILADSISKDLISEVDEKFVKLGIDYEYKYGLTKAVFGTRLLHIQLETTPNQRANFLGGALVSNDLYDYIIDFVKEDNDCKVIIGGSAPLRNLFEIALLYHGIPKERITLLNDEITKVATAVGGFKIIDDTGGRFSCVIKSSKERRLVNGNKFR